MKVNSPREKTVSIDKVKEAMRLASMEFIEVDGCILVNKKGRRAIFNPMVSDDDAILLAESFGIHIDRVTFIGGESIGASLYCYYRTKNPSINQRFIKSLSVKVRYMVRKEIVSFILDRKVAKDCNCVREIERFVWL